MNNCVNKRVSNKKQSGKQDRLCDVYWKEEKRKREKPNLILIVTSCDQKKKNLPTEATQSNVEPQWRMMGEETSGMPEQATLNTAISYFQSCAIGPHAPIRAPSDFDKRIEPNNDAWIQTVHLWI